MLGVGWTEMLIIGVVALIVIGPKDLPMMMRRVGQFAGTIRRMGTEFQREINRSTGLDEIKNLRTSITAPLKKTTDEIRREFNAMTPTGGVKPSGVIKPADPKAESVVDEIKAAAGMTPAAINPAATTPAIAATKETAAVESKPPVRASRVPKPVKADAVEAPKKATAKRVVAKKEAEASPAPIEAIAPVRKAAVRKAVKVEAEAKPKVAPKPRTRKPAKTEAAE